MATAAETIIKALSKALGITFAYGCGAYRAQLDGALLTVRRMAPGSTVAELELAGDISRSEEIRTLVRLAEVLRAAGYAPVRDARSVRVNWNVLPLAA